MNARSADGVVYLQLAHWPAPQTGCWLTLDRREVPVGMLALRPDGPGYVTALGGLEARGLDPADRTVVLADLDLGAATSLLTEQALAEVDLGGAEVRGHVVPVRVTVAKGRLTNLSMTGEAMVRALVETGASVSDEAEQVLPTTSYSVDYALPRAELAGLGPVRPPPDALVMTAETASAGCNL